MHKNSYPFAERAETLRGRPDAAGKFRKTSIGTTLFLPSFLPFLAALLLPCSCTRENYHVINKMQVYSVQRHGDSIYFSTADSGVFRFSPSSPDSIRRVGKPYRHPVRSLAFSKSGDCFAVSYFSDIRTGDSLLPCILFPQPAWSVKTDEKGDPWLAGIGGIYRRRGDSLVTWSRMSDVHDIAFFGKEVAVAHRGGISLFDRETGALTREYCKGVVCWTVGIFDSLCIGGGLNVCAIIDKSGCKTVIFGPQRNMVWSIARMPDGTLYLATQSGLFRAEKGADRAQLAGFRGICIKSILLDDKGRLWIGRFSKNKEFKE
jgi:hypothetical protein